MRDAANFFGNEFFDARDKLVDLHKDLLFPELSLKFDTKPAATLQLHSNQNSNKKKNELGCGRAANLRGRRTKAYGQG